MLNAISVLYVNLVVFVFIFSAHMLKRKRAVIYKFLPNLNISKSCSFGFVATNFVGQNAQLFCFKGGAVCFDFYEKSQLFLLFCEENFDPILPKIEKFSINSISRKYLINGQQLCVKIENNGIESVFLNSMNKSIKICFFKFGNFTIKKASKRNGFYVFLNGKRFGLFIDNTCAKCFIDLNKFGFVLNLNKSTRFDIIFENFSFNKIGANALKNKTNNFFGVPAINGVLPNFDALFFQNEPLKYRFATDFLKNIKHNFVFLPCSYNILNVDKIINFSCKKASKQFLFSLNDFGFSRFTKEQKWGKRVQIFDCLTKFKADFCFNCEILCLTKFCFMGDMRLLITLKQKASFALKVWGHDLSLLCDKAIITTSSPTKNILNFDFQFSIFGVLMLFNKLVLMGNLDLCQKHFKSLNVLVFKKQQQKQLANLILSQVTVFKNQSILKQKSVCKLLLQSFNPKKLDEFSFLYLKKLLPFFKEPAIKSKINTYLKNHQPNHFTTFEGVFCHELGITPKKTGNFNNIKLDTTNYKDLELECKIFNKSATLKFNSRGFCCFNGKKFFGKTTIIV